MYTTYVICSLKTKKYYIGCTNNIERRLDEHNRNKTKSLKNKGPFELVYFENFLTFSGARKREIKIKSYKGGNAFKKLVNVQR